MRLPKRISPCPIAESVVELRFTTSLPPQAVFGIIYGKVGKHYDKKVETLPILELPQVIRTQDPNLKFQPYYKLTGGDFKLQIGPRMISISNVKNYVGWDNFSARFVETFENVTELGVFDKVLRLGLRYINFFDFDIFEKITFQPMMNAEPYVADNLYIKSEKKVGRYNSILQITNNARRIERGEKGSTIDVDIATENQEDLQISKIAERLEGAHLAEKTIFFGLLRHEYLKSLSPEY